MKTNESRTEYLYGFDAKKLENMNYPDAIEFKINSAKKLLDTLTSVDYLHRDNERVNEVLFKIEENKILLREMES